MSDRGFDLQPRGLVDTKPSLKLDPRHGRGCVVYNVLAGKSSVMVIRPHRRTNPEVALIMGVVFLCTRVVDDRTR